MIRRCTSKDVMQEYRLSQGERLVTVTPKGTFSRRRVSKAPVLDLIERLDWLNEAGGRIEVKTIDPKKMPALPYDFEIWDEIGPAPRALWDEDDGA